jgi:dedicator of cytokinesis protein 3
MSKTLLVESLRMAFAVPGIDEELAAKVEELLNSVELFFELLVCAYGESHEADVELEHILKLMEFVKGMNRRDIYLKYMYPLFFPFTYTSHQLARRHETNGFFVEAGLALKLEADLYEWDLEAQLEESTEPDHPIQTHFARKESLYKRIIDLFDKGKAWEKATELCKELAQQYETRTLDYLSLKNILLQHASFLDLILTVDRPAPSYFRVHCWGQAWPLAQRNKDWIVQGADWEKVSSFSERMQLLYPTAQLVNANTMPSFEAMDKGQYLQVVALVSIPDRSDPVFAIPGVSPRIRQYHEHHFVKQFSYQMMSRKASSNRPDNPDSNMDAVSDVWTERRILYSEATFPNMARKANVVNYATIRSSPIENAIQAIKSKNDELLELERKFEPLSHDEDKEDVNVNSLSLALTSVIDSPLNGGVHKYKEAFLAETYVSKQGGNKEEMEFIRRLKNAIEDQVIIVRRCLEIHQNLVSKEMKPFHKSLVERI